MFQDWFTLIVIATFLYGVKDFLYKMASERRIPSVAVVNLTTTAVFVLSFLANLARGFPFADLPLTLLLVCGNGLFFLLGNVLKMEALRHAPSSMVFPLNRMNVLFVLLIAISVFDETPGAMQYAGIAVACVMIFAARKHSSRGSVDHGHFKGFIMALAAGACTAVSVSFGRVAARSGIDRLSYVMLSYGLVSLLSYGWHKGVRGGNYTMGKYGVGIAVAAGCMNFVGYLLVLQAFSIGPLSLIHPVFSMSIIIPIALSVLIYRERLTPRNCVAIALCFTAVYLLKAGK